MLLGVPGLLLLSKQQLLQAAFGSDELGSYLCHFVLLNHNFKSLCQRFQLWKLMRSCCLWCRRDFTPWLSTVPGQPRLCCGPTAGAGEQQPLNWKTRRDGFKWSWIALRWCCCASGQGKGWGRKAGGVCLLLWDLWVPHVAQFVHKCVHTPTVHLRCVCTRRHVYAYRRTQNLHLRAIPFQIKACHGFISSGSGVPSSWRVAGCAAVLSVPWGKTCEDFLWWPAQVWASYMVRSVPPVPRACAVVTLHMWHQHMVAMGGVWGRATLSK